MAVPTLPRFPIYVPTKGRAGVATTPLNLLKMGVPFTLVVEQQEWDSYAAVFGEDCLLVLDPQYQEDYDTYDDLGDSKSRGPGPARNFIWDHSIEQGHEWHWVMDDNILRFLRLHDNARRELTDGVGFHAMETFVLRYTNIAMAGPHYEMFAPNREKRPPYVTGCRIYSCNLIRNDLGFRWAGRYNEDTDLSLRMMKAGWATVQFFAFLASKLRTQAMGGGNTKEFYAGEGTLAKSKMLVNRHPDVARLTWKYGRWHHHVDYSQWSGQPLIRRDDYDIPDENPYEGMKLVDGFRPRSIRFLSDDELQHRG